MTDEKAGEAKKFTLEKVWAFVTPDPRKDGAEGVVSMSTPHGIIPMTAFDEKQLALYSNMAQNMVDQVGTTINCYCFSSRELHAKFEKKLVKEVGGIIGYKGGVIGG